MMELSHKRFDEVFDLQLGRTPARGVDKYWGGTNTWVSIADMGQSKFISSSKECISDIALAETGIPLVPKDIVIMSFKLSIGKVAITKRELYTNEAIMAFIPKPETKILNDYLYYYLQGYQWENSNNVVLGFTLNKKSISSSIIAFPSLAEQQRIVDVLDREFAKIDALKASAEKSLQAAKDLFLQMLAHTFANPSWSWKRIGEVFDTGAGGTPLKTYQEYYENGDIPWLRSGEVCKKYITETEMFITKLGMDNSSAKMFPENTVVVAMYGATAGQVGILHLETTTNQAVCGIFPNKDYVPEFIYYSLLNSKKELVAQATGNAQPNISQIKIKNTSIPVISRKEQEDVVSSLDDLNEKCSTLQDNYQKTLTLCDDLKQSLLRKAFSGEL